MAEFSSILLHLSCFPMVKTWSWGFAFILWRLEFFSGYAWSICSILSQIKLNIFLKLSWCLLSMLNKNELSMRLSICWDWSLLAELEDRVFGLVFNSLLHTNTDGAFKCPDCSHVLMICSQDLVWIFLVQSEQDFIWKAADGRKGRDPSI